MIVAASSIVQGNICSENGLLRWYFFFIYLVPKHT